MKCVLGDLPISAEHLARKVIGELRPLAKTEVGNTEWTGVVKTTFATLASKYHCQPLYASKEPKRSEFMLDFVWWNESEERAILGLESEWGNPWDYKSPKNHGNVIEAIVEDFWKLLVFKAPLKVLVHTTVNAQMRHDLDHRLRSEISRYSQHLAGECYLLLEFSVAGECCCYKFVAEANGRVQNPAFEPLDNESVMALKAKA
jgi:hypothetical protein